MNAHLKVRTTPTTTKLLTKNTQIRLDNHKNCHISCIVRVLNLKETIMKNQLKLRHLKEKTLKVGDIVRITDGSSLTAANYEDEVYIIFPYEKLTGREDKLKDINGVVIEIGVKGLFCKGSIGYIYSQDIAITLGTGIFYTHSSMVRVVE